MNNVHEILAWKGYTPGPFPQECDAVVCDGAIVQWNHIDQQPTTETLVSWSNDPAFVEWFAEHGGNAALTLRRLAREYLDDAVKAEAATVRALALTTLAELNVIRAWLAAFKDEVAAATTLADLKARLATLPATPARTVEQLRDAIGKSVGENWSCSDSAQSPKAPSPRCQMGPRPSQSSRDYSPNEGQQ